MTRRSVQLVVLCEDQQQEVFARRFFIKRGVHPRNIKIKKSPKGKGAAEQYVRERYSQEVKAYRSKSPNLSIALAVIIDADPQNTVEQRLRELDSTLEEKRQEGEKIAIFVPKRNIETWIYYLRERDVNEEESYLKLSRTGDCKPDVDRLVQDICPSGLPQDAPPSLRAACGELERILPSK